MHSRWILLRIYWLQAFRDQHCLLTVCSMVEKPNTTIRVTHGASNSPLQIRHCSKHIDGCIRRLVGRVL
jgi:hypothetical protein